MFHGVVSGLRGRLSLLALFWLSLTCADAVQAVPRRVAITPENRAEFMRLPGAQRRSRLRCYQAADGSVYAGKVQHDLWRRLRQKNSDGTTRWQSVQFDYLCRQKAAGGKGADVSISAGEACRLSTNFQWATVLEGEEVEITFQARSACGAALQFSVDVYPVIGEIVAENMPRVRYRASGHEWWDGIRFKVVDSLGQVVLGIVLIERLPNNCSLQARDEERRLIAGSSAAIDLSPQQECVGPYRFTIVRAPERGTLSGILPRLTYHAPSAPGADFFVYKLENSRGDQHLGRMRFQVRPVPAAFTGAEGFGAPAQGGRGGRVVAVTNLQDHGEGSLRAALAVEGPKTVVFRVAGTIDVNGNLRIPAYTTLAGQTAPGGGITLRSRDGTATPLVVDGDHVIVRYLRVRSGAGDPSDPTPRQDDALEVWSGRYVMIDHVSLSWASDEVFSTWDCSGGRNPPRDITIQWSIIAEGLARSYHPKKMPHSMGSMIGLGTDRLTMHHNLYAHNSWRSPFLSIQNESQLSYFDVRNNVIFNWTIFATGLSGAVAADVVANYYKPGPDSFAVERPAHYPENFTYPGISFRYGQPQKAGQLYVGGNITPEDPTGSVNGPEMVGNASTFGTVVEQPLRFSNVTTTSAENAYSAVLNYAGATVPQRDSVDLRIITETRYGLGKIIDDPSQVGGWPWLEEGQAPLDSDHDGMPDEFENGCGLNPYDAEDRNGDLDGDGYTNLEVYLNGLVE